MLRTPLIAVTEELSPSIVGGDHGRLVAGVVGVRVFSVAGGRLHALVTIVAGELMHGFIVGVVDEAKEVLAIEVGTDASLPDIEVVSDGEVGEVGWGGAWAHNLLSCSTSCA
jgi:hypothetical protein